MACEKWEESFETNWELKKQALIFNQELKVTKKPVIDYIIDFWQFFKPFSGTLILHIYPPLRLNVTQRPPTKSATYLALNGSWVQQRDIWNPFSQIFIHTCTSIKLDHEHTKKKDHIITDLSDTEVWPQIFWTTSQHANRYAMSFLLATLSI